MEFEIFYSTWHRPYSVRFSRHSILNSDQNLSQFLCANLYLNHFSNCFTSEVFTKWNSYGGTPINEQQKNDRHHPNKTAGNVLPNYPTLIQILLWLKPTCLFALLQNFSRTDRLLRHRRLCTVGMSKEESQYSQDSSTHPASWSPLHPSSNRLTV